MRTRTQGMCVSAAIVVVGLVLVPAVARAQTVVSGSIAGVVRDTSGAVLPGVTVEAASPALIEKVRTVVTDGQGRYNIVDLRPGAYTVTFTLPGFSTARREGIELTTGFTATVNAEMRVGALEETVTVTGASPIVDTQNVRTQKVLSHEYLETVPTGKNGPSLAALIVGAAGTTLGDVGGSKGEQVSTVSFHGNRPQDQSLMVDGMRYQFMSDRGGGASRAYYVNHISTQEVVLETSGMSAESETSGIQQNVVPKDGGNMFQLLAMGNYSGRSLAADSLTDTLRARGLTSTNSIRRLYDVGAGLGGPIKKDTLWFYTGHRWWDAGEYLAGNYFNKTPNTLFYTPDFSRQAFFHTESRDNNVRLTWQATSKHKLTLFESIQRSCVCNIGLAGNPNQSPEADVHVRFGTPFLAMTQATWSYPATSRLLFQVGASHAYSPWSRDPTEGVTSDAISVTELSTGYRYGAFISSNVRTLSYTDYKNHSIYLRGSGSYVTGSHALKAGVTLFAGVPADDNYTYPFLRPISYAVRTPAPGAAPVPVSITQYAIPSRSKTGAERIGLYVQDQWTVRRLTLNLGVRFDYLHAWVPAFTRPGGQFVPEFSFAKLDNVPNWKDVGPRLGAAYDVFGNAKTAIKASLGRYVITEATTLANANSPANALVVSADRVWNDVNGDYVPQDSELGPLSNRAFGTVVQNTFYADEVLQGWGVRPFNWTASAGLQQELRPGLGLEINYFRTSYGNFGAGNPGEVNVPPVTDNLNVTPADYSPYCVTAPVDARLPGGGGNQICGLYDITPTAFGSVRNLVRRASDFGKQTEVYNGMDLSVNARFGQGGVLNGGVAYGRRTTDNCFVVDSPQQLYLCKVTTPSTQLKINGAYPLPWDLQVSWVYQNLQGVPILANLVYTNAQIAPSLGRNLGACGTRVPCNATAAVSLIEPGTQFEDRYTQLDLRLTKTVRMGRARLQGMVDAYNVLGASSITRRNDTFGPAWGRPLGIQLGRLFKLGGQLDW